MKIQKVITLAETMDGDIQLCYRDTQARPLRYATQSPTHHRAGGATQATQAMA